MEFNCHNLVKNNAETSSFHQAIKTNINYNFGKSSIGVGYERVAPEYRTLGAYFFNNNLENITLNGKTGLFKSKVQLSGNVGLQRDNLAKTELSSMKRIVSSISLSYAPTKKLNLSGSYSNFMSYSIIRPEIDQINPLLPNQPITGKDFTQLSHNSSLNASYIIKAEKDNSQLLNLNLSQQIATNEQNGQKQNSGTEFYNANFSYTKKTKKLGAISVTLNGNMNKAQSVQTIALAPGLTYSKLIKEKLQASLGATYSLGYNNSISTKNVANFRLNLGYTIKKAHQFSLGSIYLYSPAANTQTKLSELTTTLSYSYRFKTKPVMVGKNKKVK